MQNKQELRKFGFLMGGIVGLLFGLIFPFMGSNTYPAWPWIIAGIFVAISIFQAKLLKQVYQTWMKIGHVLGWVNTRIILSILFFGILTPIGFILRAMGKDPLHKKINIDTESYRVKCQPIHPEEFERPF